MGKIGRLLFMVGAIFFLSGCQPAPSEVSAEPAILDVTLSPAQPVAHVDVSLESSHEVARSFVIKVPADLSTEVSITSRGESVRQSRYLDDSNTQDEDSQTPTELIVIDQGFEAGHEDPTVKLQFALPPEATSEITFQVELEADGNYEHLPNAQDIQEDDITAELVTSIAAAPYTNPIIVPHGRRSVGNQLERYLIQVNSDQAVTGNGIVIDTTNAKPGLPDSFHGGKDTSHDDLSPIIDGLIPWPSNCIAGPCSETIRVDVRGQFGSSLRFTADDPEAVLTLADLSPQLSYDYIFTYAPDAEVDERPQSIVWRFNVDSPEAVWRDEVHLFFECYKCGDLEVSDADTGDELEVVDNQLTLDTDDGARRRLKIATVDGAPLDTTRLSIDVQTISSKDEPMGLSALFET